MYKKYNEKRHYETKHSSTFNKLSEADRIEKAKQLDDSLATQEQYFKRAHESNKNITKASLEVALLVAKHNKPFAEGEFVKNLCYENGRTHLPPKQEGLRQRLFRSDTVARRIEELFTDVRRQLGDKSLNFDFFSLACNESTQLNY